MFREATYRIRRQGYPLHCTLLGLIRVSKQLEGVETACGQTHQRVRDDAQLFGGTDISVSNGDAGGIVAWLFWWVAVAVNVISRGSVMPMNSSPRTFLRVAATAVELDAGYI